MLSSFVLFFPFFHFSWSLLFSLYITYFDHSCCEPKKFFKLTCLPSIRSEHSAYVKSNLQLHWCSFHLSFISSSLYLSLLVFRSLSLFLSVPLSIYSSLTHSHLHSHIINIIYFIYPSTLLYSHQFY